MNFSKNENTGGSRKPSKVLVVILFVQLLIAGFFFQIGLRSLALANISSEAMIVTIVSLLLLIHAIWMLLRIRRQRSE